MAGLQVVGETPTLLSTRALAAWLWVEVERGTGRGAGYRVTGGET